MKRRRVARPAGAEDSGLPGWIMRDPALSVACGPLAELLEEARHDDCNHVGAIIGAPEGEVMLCACECHKSCPQAGSRSMGYLDLRSSCTCPGADAWRRKQDEAGIDPALIARSLEDARRGSINNEPDEAVRKERLRAMFAQMYREAAAQAVGQPVDPDTGPFFSVTPQEAKNLFILKLASLESDADIARRLGLTEAQVAMAKAVASEFRLAQVMEHANLSGRQKKRLAMAWAKAESDMFGFPTL
jgi:hypothetical protein